MQEQQLQKQLALKEKELNSKQNSKQTTSTSTTATTTADKTIKSRTVSTSKNSTDDISVHYIILDGLTSSWREFLALHELSTKVQLAPHILNPTPRAVPSGIMTPNGRDVSVHDNDWYVLSALYCTHDIHST